MTKGLIGLIFPAARFGLFLLAHEESSLSSELRPALEYARFFPVAAPRHVLAADAESRPGDGSRLFWFYFVNEHMNRFLGTRVPPGYDTVPLFIFWGLLVAWLLPWSAFCRRRCWRFPLRLRQLRADLSAASRKRTCFSFYGRS